MNSSPLAPTVIAYSENIEGYRLLTVQGSLPPHLLIPLLSHGMLRTTSPLLRAPLPDLLQFLEKSPATSPDAVTTGTEGAWRNFCAWATEQPGLIGVWSRSLYLLMEATAPKRLPPGDWHIPYESNAEGRGALPRVHRAIARLDTGRDEWEQEEADDYVKGLVGAGWLTALEHVAQATSGGVTYGAYRGYHPFRFRFEGQYRQHWQANPVHIKEWKEDRLLDGSEAPLESELGGCAEPAPQAARARGAARRGAGLEAREGLAAG